MAGAERGDRRRVDGDRHGLVAVLGEQSGREGHQGRDTQAGEGQDDHLSVHRPHITEDPAVVAPETAEHPDAERVGPEVREQPVQGRVVPVRVQSPRDVEVQNQQRDGDGEHAVGECQQPVGPAVGARCPHEDDGKGRVASRSASTPGHAPASPHLTHPRPAAACCTASPPGSRTAGSVPPAAARRAPA